MTMTTEMLRPTLGDTIDAPALNFQVMYPEVQIETPEQLADIRAEILINSFGTHSVRKIAALSEDSARSLLSLFHPNGSTD